MFRFKRMLLGFMLLGYLLAGGAGAQYLCHEADGTTSTESKFARCCSDQESSPAPASASKQPLATAQAGAPPDACIDTPVPSIGRARSSSDVFGPDLGQSVSFFPFVVILQDARLALPLRHEAYGLPPVCASPPEQVATIVLRC
jgi:hypothetical protein